MSEPRRPLTDHVTNASQPDFSRLGWIAAVIGGVLAAVFLVLWSNALSRQHELESFRDKLSGANAALGAAQDANQKLRDQIDALQKQVADLEQQKSDAAQMSKGLEDEMRADLASRDVTISKLQGQLTVNIMDRVLFSSGEAVLQPEGEAVMRKIAALLVAHPELKIQVVGHTDNVPIRPGARGQFASNWELSTARALAAVHFLTERAGVDPRRVGAAGYGEFRPVADNATADGRAKNRRIAITIMPLESGTPDTNAPALTPPPSTQSAPPMMPPPGDLPPGTPLPPGGAVPLNTPGN
jgi:chemotaxis protein MotB